MYIIINYISNTMSDNINIVYDNEEKDVMLFDTYVDAEDYAVQECAWNYKIVKL